MHIPYSLFKPHTVTAMCNRKQDVVTLRDSLSRLGLNGRHMHVLHGASGLLTLNGRRDGRKQDFLTQLLNFVLNRVAARSDQEGTEVLQQGGWVVLIDLPQDPNDRKLIQGLFNVAGEAGVIYPDRPLAETATPHFARRSVSAA